jgi:hypothetical protein
METLRSRRISCTVQLNPHLESTPRSRALTDNINNSDLVEAKLKSPSESESVRARVSGTLSSPR